MLPALARRAIETYTAPGDLVIDPMCGIGTTLVEAVHLRRRPRKRPAVQWRSGVLVPGAGLGVERGADAGQ